MRGGEKALEVFCEIFPAADLFTLVYLPGTTSPIIERRIGETLGDPVAADGGQALSPIPAALPDRRRAVRSRRLRPGDQHEPLRGEVGGRHRPGAASVLLPDTDALRVGSVRRVFRARSRRANSATWCCGRCWRAWRGGTAPPKAVYTAISLSLNMLRGGSRCTIIVSRPLCTLRSTPSSTPPTHLPAGPASATQPPKFLVVSALVPYKRVDLAMMAARQAGVGLTVVGNGPERVEPRAAGRRRHRAGSAGAPTKKFAICIAPRPRPSCPAKKTSASSRSKRRPAAAPSWRSAAAAHSTR